jgi:tyrosine-protein kinase Etk/Wzc
MEAEPREEIRIADYIQVLFRRRLAAALAFLVACISVAIHTFMAMPLYEASSTIQIKERGKKSLLAELVGADQTNTVAAEIEIIKSRSLAEEVVKDLSLDTILIGFPYGVGLYFEDLRVGKAYKGKTFTATFDTAEGDYTISQGGDVTGTGKLGEQFVSPETNPKKMVRFNYYGSGAAKGAWFRFRQIPFRSAARQVMDRTDVRTVGDKNTQILRVFHRDPVPYMARKIVDSIVDVYIRRNISENAREARETLSFIEKQRGLVQKQLNQSEEALRNYKAEEGVMSLPDETATIIQGYAQFAVEKNRLGIETRYYKSMLSMLSDPAATSFTLPAMSKENTVLSNMSLELTSLGTKKQEMLALFTESHPEIIAIQMQIDELKQKIKQVIISTLNSFDARSEEIQDVMGDYNARLRLLPDKERDLAELMRAQQVAGEIYAFLSQKREEARITEASTIGNVSIIDSAEVPLAPVSPNVKLNLMMGILVGLVLAIGVAFFLEFIDDSLKSTEEVERNVKRPIYGIIPRIAAPRVPDEEGGPPAASLNLVTRHSPKSPISESFRTLRTNIHYAQPDKAASQILITSAGPSEGKSTVVSNLALTIANTGKKTILIDCDLRKPNIHNFFELSRDPGVTTILSQEQSWSEVMRETGVENLWVIPSGPIPPNPTEMLGSQAMKDLVAELDDEFDMVLLDSPPVVAVTDAAILSSFIQTTLLVVELGRARSSGVNRAVDLLEKVNANLMGLVTNNISSGYRYDYGYYSTYYYTDSGEKKKRKKRRGRYGY